MLKYLRLILLPLSFIYGLVTTIRNWLYDKGLLKSVSFDIPVISVGNLAVGGSGKTPATEYLVRLLSGYKIAILSRGYGRKTKGFILADEHATAATIGDEPMQYYHKFKQVTVAVCEDRIKGISLLKEQHDIILLDDAFQHRRVKPGFSILLFEFDKLSRFQFILPAGNLRETFDGVTRADSVLVTKCPPLSSLNLKLAVSHKFELTSHQNLAFAGIAYEKPVHLFKREVYNKSIGGEVFLLTAIANSKPLVEYLNKFPVNLHHFKYADHHNFTVNEINRLVKAFEQNPAQEKIIITTEKDAQRLLNNNLRDLLLNLPVYCLPISMVVQEEDKQTFDQKILNYVASFRRFS
ncbi:tetraacyldisaccharide 4'-kinase [Pedobacter montanisoli]|uniref:Tetraacyldisaccharide 4'-kinase n=1 Tax=Pedobacter montanisoli TaxID=2923277 RepID=A0ABS9ZWE6_9SPHI|nr:tetraacyldisaccharide 4'-kinase [Pedobacter montanisoli]MCJ0742631.1 tetraacyldisaccharide 4'-kinase [Pedobacter montanisoli]